MQVLTLPQHNSPTLPTSYHSYPAHSTLSLPLSPHLPPTNSSYDQEAGPDLGIVCDEDSGGNAIGEKIAEATRDEHLQ